MPHLHHGYNFTAVPHVLKSSISDERRIRSNVSQYLLLSFSLLLNIVQESAKSIKKRSPQICDDDTSTHDDDSQNRYILNADGVVIS